MSQLLSEFTQALSHHSFLKLVLSRPTRQQVAPAKKIVIRPVQLKSGICLQASVSDGRQERHLNFTNDEGIATVTNWLATDFEEANLFTNSKDVAARFRSGREVHCRQQAATMTKAVLPVTHNRSKCYLIPEGVPCAFLIEMGVMSADGRVKAAKYDKYRQINRFLELVNDTIGDLPVADPLRVVDFGCGKSYLTFAIHHLLTVIHRRSVEILGLDLKREVIEHCQQVSQKLKCDGLRFEVGDIAGYQMEFPAHLTVSLHACDTATDAALAQAIAWQSEVILCVPCCQHELASSMCPEMLKPLMRYGILKERWAALATDALRAQALEMCGYATQVLEFIDMEHTPKNLLIRAVRRRSHQTASADRWSEWEKYKSELGIEVGALERLLRERQLGPWGQELSQ